MAVTAKIKFTQGALNPPAGEALIGVAGVPVQCTNADNSNVSTFTWEMVDKPPTSAVGLGVVALGQVPIFEFLPDQPGGYHLHLTTVDLAGNKAEDFRVFQVPEPSGYVIPPFLARGPAMNFGGQLRGWAKPVEELLRYLLTGAAPVGGAVNWGVRKTLGNTTMSASETVIAADTLAVAITVSLPVNPGVGRVAAVFDYSGNASPTRQLIVSGNGKTISGQPSYVMADPYSALLLIYTGSEWNIVGAFPAGGGGGGASTSDLVFSAEMVSEGAGVWTRAGARKIDLSLFPAVAGGKARRVRLYTTLEKASAAAGYSGEARLFDLDAGVAITGSGVTLSGVPFPSLPNELFATLTPGTTAGTIRSDTPHLYEVQFRANGALTPPNDRAILSNARVEIAYV